MSGIVAWSMSRARSVCAGLVLILVAGLIAWLDISKEANPDVQIPIIVVSVRLDGVSPADGDRLIVRPIETEIRSIEGLKEIRSTSYEGLAYVVLEFEAGFDGDKALRDVREKVDLARPKLPAEAKEPEIKEVNVGLFPVLVVALAGDLSDRALQRLADDLKDRIEAIPMVLEAEIAGKREEQVEILVDPLAVESYGLAADQVASLIQRSNQIIAAGALDGGAGRFGIKAPGLFENTKTILDLPVKVVDQTVVRFADVTSVRRTFKDRVGYARVDGRPAVVLEVKKRTGRNLIETVAAVKTVVEESRGFWPEGVQVSYLLDQSDTIRTMLSDLTNNLATAVLLVLIIVLASLGLRTTALVAVAVPGSFLAGILVLSGMGLTVNVVVLFGLIYAAGNIVDGAIVVAEHADAKMAEGAPRDVAYREAAQRMAWPIVASTATQLAAFAPMLFWPGTVGEFMKFLPITQFAVMIAALGMALIFIPVLGGIFGRAGGGAGQSEAMAAIRSGGGRAQGLLGAYLGLLGWCLRRPVLTLLAMLALVVGIVMAFTRYNAGVEFFPSIEPEIAQIQVMGRGNLAIDEQDRLVAEVEALILDLKARTGEIDSVYVRTSRPTGAQEVPPDTIGVIQMDFADWRQRRRAEDILAEIIARAETIAGIRVAPFIEEGGPPTGKPVQLVLTTETPELLIPTVAKIRARLDQMTGLRGVEDDRPLPGIDWRVEVDRAAAARFGADLASVGSALRLVTNGLKLSTYRPEDADDEVDIVVRYPPEQRSLATLDAIRVQTAQGLAPISNFVARVAEPRVSSVKRIDGKRAMTIKADVADGVLADVKIQEVRAFLAELDLDPRVQIRFKGVDEEQQKAQEFLSKAFLLALFLIGLILLTQFNSFSSTVLMVSAVLLSTIGVLIGLMAMQQPFGVVMTGIGVVALAGIVVNNNIVLIDAFDHYAKIAKDTREAVLLTGAERLRPVLLTALNNVLGLLPLMLGVNIDIPAREVLIGAPSTQWWVQLSTAIVFGSLFATLLTLIVTPCGLMLRGNLRDWRRRRLARTSAAPLPAE